MTRLLPCWILLTCIGLTAACSGKDAGKPMEKAKGRAIDQLYPSETRAGKPFNVQPNRASAIAVMGSGFLPGDTIFWNGKPLKTVYGNTSLVTAEVAAELFSQPGDVTVTVKNPANPSSVEVRATFKVLASR